MNDNEEKLVHILLYIYRPRVGCWATLYLVVGTVPVEYETAWDNAKSVWDLVGVPSVENRTQLPLALGFTLAHGHTGLVM